MSGKFNNFEAITFDDVLLVPQYSDIKSRSKCDTSTILGPKHSLKIPIISANMDTITGVKMAEGMAKLGGLGIIHRYMPYHYPEHIFTEWNESNKLLSFSVGSIDNDKDKIDLLLYLWINSGKPHYSICVDLAHGNSINMKETLQYIRKQGFNGLLIAGNVATRDGAVNLREWGADIVKVGIGAGSVCSTRIKTGCGIPQLTAIMDCADSGRIPIIADGGFKTIGDICKALAFPGVVACMTGSLFAGTDLTEKPDEYRGMASAKAQKEFKGKFANAEGVSFDIKPRGKGSTKKVLMEIKEGIQSAMSYVGAKNLTEYQQKARFTKVSSHTVMENHPHFKQ